MAPIARFSGDDEDLSKGTAEGMVKQFRATEKVGSEVKSKWGRSTHQHEVGFYGTMFDFKSVVFAVLRFDWIAIFK